MSTDTHRLNNGYHNLYHNQCSLTLRVKGLLKLLANGRNNSQHCCPTMLGVVPSVCCSVRPVSNIAHWQLPRTCKRVWKWTQRVTSNNTGSCLPTMRPFTEGLINIQYSTNRPQYTKNETLHTNRPIPSCSSLCFKARLSAKLSQDSFCIGLVFKVRVFLTRKWPMWIISRNKKKPTY